MRNFKTKKKITEARKHLQFLENIMDPSYEIPVDTVLAIEDEQSEIQAAPVDNTPNPTVNVTTPSGTTVSVTEAEDDEFFGGDSEVDIIDVETPNELDFPQSAGEGKKVMIGKLITSSGREVRLSGHEVSSGEEIVSDEEDTEEAVVEDDPLKVSNEETMFEKFERVFKENKKTIPGADIVRDVLSESLVVPPKPGWENENKTHKLPVDPVDDNSCEDHEKTGTQPENEKPEIKAPHDIPYWKKS